MFLHYYRTHSNKTVSLNYNSIVPLTSRINVLLHTLVRGGKTQVVYFCMLLSQNGKYVSSGCLYIQDLLLSEQWTFPQKIKMAAVVWGDAIEYKLMLNKLHKIYILISSP